MFCQFVFELQHSLFGKIKIVCQNLILNRERPLNVLWTFKGSLIFQRFSRGIAQICAIFGDSFFFVVFFVVLFSCLVFWGFVGISKKPFFSSFFFYLFYLFVYLIMPFTSCFCYFFFQYFEAYFK